MGRWGGIMHSRPDREWFILILFFFFLIFFFFLKFTSEDSYNTTRRGDIKLIYFRLLLLSMTPLTYLQSRDKQKNERKNKGTLCISTKLKKKK